MKHEMKRTRNILLAEFVSSISLAVAIAVLYETGTLVPGALALEKDSEFVCAAIMELATLAAIPLALRMFSIRAVKAALAKGGASSLMKFGTARILLLAVPMVANALLYYLFMATTFGYMAIILLLCMPFVCPSLGRCNYEVSQKAQGK